MLSPFCLSCSLVLVNHCRLCSERGQLCVSKQWVRFYLCFPPPPCYHAVSSNCSYEPRRPLCTMLLSMSTDMCGLRSPHKYRIRVTYSAVAIWKEFLGVVAKPFYTGQEVLVQENISHAPSTREKLRLLQADTGWVCPAGYRPQVVEAAHTFTIEGTVASTTDNEIFQHIGIVAKCKIPGFPGERQPRHEQHRRAIWSGSLLHLRGGGQCRGVHEDLRRHERFAELSYARRECCDAARGSVDRSSSSSSDKSQSHRQPLRGRRRRQTLCLIHLPPVLLLCVFGSTFQSLVVVAMCASKSFAVRSSKLSRHSQLIRAELSSNISQSHSDVCAKTRFKSHGSSTTAAKRLSYCVHQQALSQRQRRRRGTIPAHAGSPPLQHISAVWSCCFRLTPSGRPLRLRVAPCSPTQL